jgi:hypothetical protein
MVVLLDAGHLLRPASAQVIVFTSRNPWISNATASNYIYNLVGTYNAEVHSSYGENPSTNITSHFPLYLPYAKTFEVYAMEDQPGNNSTAGFVFVTQVGCYNVLRNQSDCIQFYDYNNMSVQVNIFSNATNEKPYANSSSGTFYYDIGKVPNWYAVWITPTAYVLNNTVTDAEKAGIALFKHDQAAYNSAFQAPGAFPPNREIHAYINNLFTDYNTLLIQHGWESNPRIPLVAQNFTLYPFSYWTFEVVVMVAGPHDNSTLNMLFIPIRGEQNQIAYWNNFYLYNISSEASQTPIARTVSQTTGVNFSETITYTASLSIRVNLTTDYDAANNLYFSHNGTYLFAAVAIGVKTSDITASNSSAYAMSEAQFLYDRDAGMAERFLASQSTISSITATSQSQTQSKTLSDWWADSSISRFVIAIWGSWLTFVVFWVAIALFAYAVSRRGFRQAIGELWDKL